MAVSIDQALQTAIAHHQAGRLVEASQIYQQILSQQPNQPDALHLLGLLARRSGNQTLALALLKQAVSVNPNSPNFQSNLGITLLDAGHVNEAIAALQKAVQLAPTFAEALSNLGSALMKKSQPDQAAIAFSRAIELRPNLFESHLGLASALRDLGKLTEAIEGYRQAILIRPDVPQTHIELGHVLSRLGQIEAGIGSYLRAIEVAPNDVDARNSLGNAYITLEQFSEAEQAFRSALAIDSSAGAVWNNLGNLYRVQARADEALDAYQHAITANPQLGPAFSNLGNTLKDRGKLPEAIAAFRRAVELDPTSHAVASNLSYAATFDPDHDARQILDEARAWADRFETPLLPTHRPHSNDRDSNRKLRIGYVSGDFRNHVIGRNVLPILEHHDRNAFEVHCFSNLIRHDAETARFIAAADYWHECAMLSDADLAEKVRAERIDILVDLTLHISGNRLMTFARKPAPVQVTWAGYPGTTGLRSIDYRITDPYVDPLGTDDFYSEQSIRLPHSFWCYRPMAGSPEINPLPADSNGFVTFGCLNSSAKVTAKALDLWADVLHAVPNSQLLLLATPGTLCDDFVSTFKSKQIDASRLKFVAPVMPGEHLQRFHLLDISLDPLPYTGHTSTLDSLWMGVPVITLSGETSVARGSVTALSNVGLHHLIAHMSREYLSIAANLANDRARLGQLRRTLRTSLQTSPICDEVRFTRDLEIAFRQMWRKRACI